MNVNGQHLFGRVAAPLCVVAVALGACSIGGSTSGSSTGPILMAELLPMTGVNPSLGEWLLAGAQTGLYDVNTNGGVMGRTINTVLGDTAGDPVDAVSAWRQLQTRQPTFEVGPSSLEVQGVATLYDAAKLPDFVAGGTTVLDHMTYKYVWRPSSSDTTLVAAMAFYAIQKGYKNCATVFTTGPASDTEVAPLTQIFTAHGGKVPISVSIAPGQSSYRSEVVKLFATNPDCIFIHTEIADTATFFANVKELGDLKVPFVADDIATSDIWLKAAGYDTSSKWVKAFAEAPPTGPAWQHYVNVYSAVNHSTTPLPLADNLYDGVVIASLAMTDAKTTDPTVWVNKIIDVSNPPGEMVYNYADGVAALKAGKKINYEGATGPDDFNQYHNVTGGWNAVGFDTSGKSSVVLAISASDVSTYLP